MILLPATSRYSSFLQHGSSQPRSNAWADICRSNRVMRSKRWSQVALLSPVGCLVAHESVRLPCLLRLDPEHCRPKLNGHMSLTKPPHPPIQRVACYHSVLEINTFHLCQSQWLARVMPGKHCDVQVASNDGFSRCVSQPALCMSTVAEVCCVA